MSVRTKPRGIWANFCTDCTCGAEITISNGRPDPHTCQRERPTSLDDLQFPEPTE